MRSLASKPFGKEVALKGNPPERIAGKIDAVTKRRVGGIVDDIDGRGNGLTVFAREAFAQAIAKGMHGILVDYPTMQPTATKAEEQAVGARPYWVQIPAENIIALYTDVEGGREVITHVRIAETVIERDGYDEIKLERIRILEPGRWELWEKRATIDKPSDPSWVKVDSGTLARSGECNSVPLVLFFTGDRTGTQGVRPPLADLAHMQIELYRALSRQDEILTYAGSPMVVANGLAAPSADNQIEIGPKVILFAPAAGEGIKTGWEFIQPSAANITEVRNHVTSVQEDMRRIGMQPMTEMPGNPSATGQSISAAKAHSAVKAWALMLNDCLEQAFTFTAEWMNLPDVIETEISTDFSVQPYAQFPLAALAAARGTKDLSQKTYWEGLRRFDVLSQDFDPEAEIRLLQTENDELAKARAADAENAANAGAPGASSEADAEPPAQETVQVRV